MNLFLNAVSSDGVIILFDNDRKIISQKDIKVAGNESEKLIGILDDFLRKNNLGYKDLQNLVVVAGPGSFTGVRTITLLINTINFVINKNITRLNYFDLFENYPIIKSSSKRDSFFKKDKFSEIEIIKNDDLLEYLQKNNITKVYGENKNILLSKSFTPREKDLNDFNLEIFEKIDYSAIIKKVNFENNKLIQPIYIKKPSIS